MVSIELQNLQLHAYHGLYDGEKKTGSPYEVNVKVSYDEGNAQFDDIRNTINYVEVFEIVKRCMAVPTPLLEKVAEGIIRRIKHQYPFSKEVIISIYKLEPPIENIQGKIGISMKKEWER
ncbi:dihydroneopterin aldolase [Pseudoflavitalea sp. G-6-1-2]|uniref:dihydroneopterin aldolase n=1 Tax=Pseudoflavitalea sp. G-6-1-2 TaxID=2728841 RepID=UPI00146D1170|nr:dihydroneopterin aldolase [Pseudoflavitalea sp. G-6-1-2]NML21941.1 dihydroneopterin aldolase [Pseudoflavitalea sp. G-6-1-2]